MNPCERGQSTVLVIFLSASLLLVGLAACLTVSVVRDVAAAETAADAAALAGVTGGRERAMTVAEANGATVESYNEEEGGEVQVTVDREGHRATSRAAPGPPGFATS